MDVNSLDPTAHILSTPPRGEYYIYTPMAAALEGLTATHAASIAIQGSATPEPQYPQHPAFRQTIVKTLVDMTADPATAQFYFDLLANAAVECPTVLTLAADRTNISICDKTDSASCPNSLAVARLSVSVPQNTQSSLVLNLKAANALLAQTKVNVLEGATLNMVLLQDGDQETQRLFTRTSVDIMANATLNLYVVNLNPALARNEVEVKLHNEGAQLNMGGIYKVAKNQKVDNETLVEHLKGHTDSQQLFKGIAEENGVMAFGGLILVKPDAQKVNASQTNRHMLASVGARAYAKPQLEIYADDVKCSHGATTGQIDPMQLFYMQQRGIDEQTARQLLSAAFVTEVVDRIPDALADVREALHQRLTNV